MPPRKTTTTKVPRASKATSPSPKKVKRAGTMAETAAEGAKFVQKAEKAATAKAKAKANAPAHPPHKVMAAEAITALKTGRKGVSAQAITKYIIGTYHIEPGHHLRTALKNGVASGYFEKVTAGTYKLGPEAKKKVPAKKKATTTTATKKKTTTTTVAKKKTPATATKKKAGTAASTKKKASTAGAKKAGTAGTKNAGSASKKAAASPKKKIVKRTGTMAETAAEGQKFLKKTSSKGKKAGARK